MEILFQMDCKSSLLIKYRGVCMLILLLIVSSCSLFEPTEERITCNYRDFYLDNKSDIRKIVSYSMDKYIEEGANIRLSYYMNLGQVKYSEEIEIKGDIYYSLNNEKEAEVTKAFYDVFRRLDITRVRSDSGNVFIEFRNSPSYYYDVHLLVTNESYYIHEFCDWFSKIEEDVYVCGNRW